MNVRTLLPRELHLSDRPSSTAQWTTLGRAFEMARAPEQRIVSDPFARVFLSASSQAVLLGLLAGAPAVRVAERAPLAGVSAFALCRHRFIDEQLLAALDAGVEQVLILGAGYDSRAYRFAPVLDGRPVFEVDLPPLSRRKAAIVAAHPELFGSSSIHRIEIDFRTQSLADRLDAGGFTPGRPTFVVWEGVSMYLSRDAVVGTLDVLRVLCGAGSRLAMDFWHELPGAGPAERIRRLGARAIALIGEPVTFGIAPDEVSEFLGMHGFATLDVVGAPQLAERYSTAGRPTEESVYVVAAAR